MLDISPPVQPVSGSFNDVLSLPAALEAAKVRAEALGVPVIARRMFYSATDPWEGRAAALGGTEPCVLWRHGTDGASLVATGVCQRTELGQGPEMLGARAACLRVLEQLVDVSSEIPAALHHLVPLTFVASAFDTLASQAGTAWDGWSAGEVQVPRTLHFALPATSTRVTGIAQMTLIDADTDVEAVVRGWEAERTSLTTSETSASGVLHRVGEARWSSDEPQAAWCARVQAAREAIAAGELHKVVLSRSATAHLTDGETVDAAGMLTALHAAHPRNFCFAVKQAGHAAPCFLGATPELLVEVAGRSVRTQALAGTAERASCPEEDAALGRALLADTKNRGEHALVADTLRTALDLHCASVSQSAEPSLVRLPRVQHLETRFEGILRRAGGVLDVLADLHPTPSVGGAPRAAAAQYLRDHEPTCRGWYAGPLGWVTPGGDGTFAVAIRSVLLRGQTAVAYAGAGIVADSDPDLEWEETELKLRTILEAIRLVG